MAKVIHERRSFKDSNSGVTTEYDYYAVQGTDENSRDYEVVFKNLVQSEKMVLKMIAKAENNSTGEVISKKASSDEQPTVKKSEGNILDDDDDSKSWFGK